MIATIASFSRSAQTCREVPRQEGRHVVVWVSKHTQETFEVGFGRGVVVRQTRANLASAQRTEKRHDGNAPELAPALRQLHHYPARPRLRRLPPRAALHSLLHPCKWRASRFCARGPHRAAKEGGASFVALGELRTGRPWRTQGRAVPRAAARRSAPSSRWPSTSWSSWVTRAWGKRRSSRASCTTSLTARIR